MGLWNRPPPDSTRPWMLQMTGDPVRLPRPEPREGRAGASVDDHKRRIGFLRDCLHRAQADIKACQDENKRLKRALDKKDPLCRDCHHKATFPGILSVIAALPTTVGSPIVGLSSA